MNWVIGSLVYLGLLLILLGVMGMNENRSHQKRKEDLKNSGE